MMLISVSFILTAVLASTKAQSNGCNYKVTGLNGVIKSPGDGSNSVHCVWNMTVPAWFRIRLQKETVQLQSCSYAWLTIRTITDNKTEIEQKFCASQKFPEVITSRSRASIEYYFNRNGGRSYFALVYTAVPVDVSEITEEWISESTEVLLSNKDSLPRAIPGLHLFNETYFHKDSINGYRFKAEYLLKLSADLLRNSSQPLMTADLSHHIMALLAVCVNPRSFHGIDLVYQLRNSMAQYPSLAKPFDFLALCSAGEILTSGDLKKLKAMTDTEKPNIYMLDFQAIGILALICPDDQQFQQAGDEIIQKTVNVLKSYQRQDGSFGSLRSTVLIVQALSEAGTPEKGWNKTSALRFIESKNHTDGSFGNVYDLYTVLPILRGKTMLNINAQKCDFSPDGVAPLEEIMDKMTEYISVTYQLWIGDEARVRHAVALRFPNSTRFFDVMRLAAKKDEKYRLNWTSLKDNLYVYQIGEHINDPTSGKYWSLYVFNNQSQLVPFGERLEKYVPDDGDTAVMWYKTVNLQE